MISIRMDGLSGIRAARDGGDERLVVLTLDVDGDGGSAGELEIVIHSMAQVYEFQRALGDATIILRSLEGK